MTSTYVFETLTSSVACSKDCRRGVAVEVVEDVWEFDGWYSVIGWCLNDGDL